MKKRIVSFLQAEAILCISAFLALVSCFFVPVDTQYLTYIDFHTLSVLFCLMAVMAGFQSVGIFDSVSFFLLRHTHSKKQLAAVLVFLCFFSSMFVTNDVALIAFVPLGILVLKMSQMQQSVLWVVSLMTVAANLGSMLTPIGNPQNLYLYTQSGLSLFSFLQLTVPFAAISLCLLMGAVFLLFFSNNASLKVDVQKPSLQSKPFFVYLFLFVLCLFCVAGFLSGWVLLAVVCVFVFFVNRTVFFRIDYSLLATFAAFFVFIGNMGRIPLFYQTVAAAVSQNELLTAVVSSQLISNVPAALLLSGFGCNFETLIIGTNIGGLGTLIASMASLISYKQICKEFPTQKGRYFVVFTILNLVFLAILFPIACFI